MKALLVKSSIRYIIKHFRLSLLSILGIALGVAMLMSIDIAISSSKKSFELSTDTIVGKTTHSISASSLGFNEDLFRKLKVNGYKKIAPVVEANLVHGDDEDKQKTLQLLGIDIFSEKDFRDIIKDDAQDIDINKFINSNAAILSQDTAQELNLKAGDHFKLRYGDSLYELELLLIFKSENKSASNIVLTDIGTAQDIVSMQGSLSRIDLILNNEAQVNQIKKLLPDSVSLNKSEMRSQATQQMTKSFNLNLTALSFLATIVAMFLIYNIMTFSILERRSQLAVLRVLGTPKKNIFQLILVEAFIFAIIGTALGAFIGIELGKLLTQLVAQTINDLYYVLEITQFQISSLSILKAITIGIGSTIIATIFPALEASNSPAQLALNKSLVEVQTKSRINIALILSICFAIVSVFLLLSSGKNLILSFIGLALVLLSFAFISPIITLIFCKILKLLMRKLFGFIGELSITSISSQLSRTAIAIAALTIAISVSASLDITVGSFRNTVISWLNSSLKADIYLSPPRVVSNKVDSIINPKVLDTLLSSDIASELDSYVTYRNITADSSLGKSQLASIDIHPEIKASIKFKSKVKELWNKFQSFNNANEIGIIISEPYAYKHSLKLSDLIKVRSDKGEITFKVLGIFYDYGTDQGIMMMHKNIYRKFWDDPNISSIGLFVKDKSRVAETTEEIKNLLLKDFNLMIRSNLELKQRSLEIFDRTFTITNVLKIIAIVVAFIGVLSSLMAILLQREKEFAILRANGLSSKKISLMLLLQCASMGLIAGIIAIPAAIAQALVMIFIINQRSFGWSLNLTLNSEIIYSTLSLALIAAIIAAIYPSFKISRTSISEGLRNE